MLIISVQDLRVIVAKIYNLKEDYEWDHVFRRVFGWFFFPGLSLSKD